MEYMEQQMQMRIEGGLMDRDDMQAEIARLQAEVDRLSGANAEVVELFHDNTWNDAIEAAASETEHHRSEEGDSLLCTIWQERIRALKRPT